VLHQLPLVSLWSMHREPQRDAIFSRSYPDAIWNSPVPELTSLPFRFVSLPWSRTALFILASVFGSYVSCQSRSFLPSFLGFPGLATGLVLDPAPVPESFATDEGLGLCPGRASLDLPLGAAFMPTVFRVTAEGASRNANALAKCPR
jgi:hypothetical protein